MSKLGKYDEEKYFSVTDYKPIITYAGDAELFKNIEAVLSQALPQESTEWRRLYSRDLKAIKLSAIFEPFSESILQHENHFHFLKQPILHVFWTQCADIDMYKTVLHDEIKLWLQILHRHNVTDWLIVLVEAYDFRKHNKLLPRTTVLDKIKGDFGVKHVDRCLSVINPLKSEFRTGSSWRALIVNMRLLILTAYDNALLKFAEFIRLRRESRKQPDWNFCDYFLLQEEFAFALEMLGVPEEALIQYDELEALFSQFIQNSSLTDAPKWLSIFQKEVNSWSSIFLTCKVNQNYREAIRNHRISLLDFRCYLFCRQSAMLLRISKPWEIAQRTLSFIHNCLNEIRILEIYYPAGAIAGWIFLCCLEVVFTCKNYNEPAHVDACSLYTAPLMELAMIKLNELGKLCGLMPDCEQTSDQLHLVVSLSAGIGDPSHLRNSNSVSPVYKLKEALSSKEAYCKYYLELSEQTMITYKHKGRVRSARYIGKKLADFYLRTGDLIKASGFLVNALTSYEEDNWPVLANEIRLQLLQCYRQLNENEKLLRTCISVTCSSQFDVSFRLSCFKDVVKILEEDETSEWIVALEDAFIINRITVEVQQSGLRGQATVVLTSKFPVNLTCSNVLIAVTNCSNDNNRKIVVAADMEHISETNFENFSKQTILSEIPLIYTLEYKQDKSLAGTRIICKNSEAYLKRQDSQKLKKSSLPMKSNFSKALVSGPVQLKPGVNSVTLLTEEDEHDGTYCLGQLSINVRDNLLFLNNSSSFSKMKYVIKHVRPKISIDTTNNNPLFVGISSTVNLCIDLETYMLREDAILKLRTCDGLKLALSNEQNLQKELKVNLPARNADSYGKFCIPLIMRSEFPPQSDNYVSDHEIWFNCPWLDAEMNLVVQFFIPFSVSYRIQTSKQRKFLMVILTGITKESIVLTNPDLNIISDKKVFVKSLNSIINRSLVIQNRLKVNFVWELVSENNEFDKCTSRFKINYAVGAETSVYTYEFKLANFMTLYSIESTVDPMRGCEFCRVNSMCHLVFTVKRIAPTTDHSLKYEVVTDQTMWAVCNMSTGVIILDETDKCSKTVDLMPLVHGYLPLPSIKLSKYFPAETNVGEKRMSPRLEPFYHGQVFYANKFTQIQVLPSLNVADA